MSRCEHCHQEIQPSLSIEEYRARAIPRLAAIDILATRIDIGGKWRWIG